MTGNAGQNEIIGNGGDDTLYGHAGMDELYGSAGQDILHGGDGADELDGGDSNDFLYGESGSDELIGGSGNDLLIGGAGADELIGSSGADTASYEGSAGGVAIDLAAETATGGDAAGDTLDTVENLTGSTYDDSLTGNSAANILSGGDGNDVLDGGAGNDTLIGGAGNDTYVVNATGDVVTEAAGEGTDTVQSSVTLTLVANVENLTLTGSSGLGATGNELANVLTGNSGANMLTGAGGDDLLDGGAGNDQMDGGGGSDTLIGGNGSDLFLFGRDSGADLVDASDNDGGYDELNVREGVDSDQLWFRQVGDDLEISIIGTNDRMTVQDWYAATSNRLDRIEISNGDYLLTSDVEALVAAMASLTPPPLGQMELSTQQQQQLAPALAASWHSA